jgi:hypothetical protein
MGRTADNGVIVNSGGQKFTEIFASEGAPPVSTTPVANFVTGGTPGVVVRQRWQIMGTISDC